MHKTNKPSVPKSILFLRGFSLCITNDDWYPSFTGGKVGLYFSKLPGRYELWRVAFWGEDDYGLERDFSSEECARRFISELPVFIEKSYLKSRGFVNI